MRKSNPAKHPIILHFVLSGRDHAIVTAMSFAQPMSNGILSSLGCTSAAPSDQLRLAGASCRALAETQQRASSF